MAKLNVSNAAMSGSIPPDEIGGGVFLMAERKIVGHLVRNPGRVRYWKRKRLRARCFVDPLYRRIFQKLVALVRWDAAPTRRNLELFMKSDPILGTLGTPQTLKALFNEAAEDERMNELSELLIARCDALGRTTSSLRQALDRQNSLERPLQIKRLAKLDAHALTKVVTGALGADALSERMGRYAQPLT